MFKNEYQIQMTSKLICKLNLTNSSMDSKNLNPIILIIKVQIFKKNQLEFNPLKSKFKRKIQKGQKLFQVSPLPQSSHQHFRKYSDQTRMLNCHLQGHEFQNCNNQRLLGKVTS